MSFNELINNYKLLNKKLEKYDFVSIQKIIRRIPPKRKMSILDQAYYWKPQTKKPLELLISFLYKN